MLFRKFLFAPMEKKNQIVSHILTKIYGCAIWSHSYKYFTRKLTVSYSDTFKRLMNVPRHTSSSLTFEMNATDHMNEVLHKSAYSFMSRVTTSPIRIVTAIVNSDAYQQSSLIDK